MLDVAIRKSEDALGRVLTMLVISAVAMLGLVWLSIAAAGWLTLLFSSAAAAAIIGGVFVGSSAIAYLISRAASGRRSEKSGALASREASKSEDVFSRAMRMAERMAPDTPVLALLFALMAGLGSVALPSALTPLLNKMLDDIEKLPEVQAKR